jgi:hypothetical protein
MLCTAAADILVWLGGETDMAGWRDKHVAQAISLAVCTVP